MLKKYFRFNYVNLVVLVIYALLITAAFFQRDKFSVDNLLKYTPQSPFLAALFVLFLYALKSVTVVFPIIVLHILSGFLFSAPVALLINCAGIVIAYSIPYALGRLRGAEKVEKRIEKSEKLQLLFEKQKKHKFFLSFFLRVISCLPCDLISLYMGSIKISYLKYIFSSVLGTLPGLIPATFIGKTVTDVFSPGFIISIAATMVSSLLSIIIFYFYNKNNKKK